MAYQLSSTKFGEGKYIHMNKEYTLVKGRGGERDPTPAKINLSLNSKGIITLSKWLPLYESKETLPGIIKDFLKMVQECLKMCRSKINNLKKKKISYMTCLF